MTKLFKKHETLFCILLIILYVVVNSFCVQSFGETSFVGFIVNTVLSLCLLGLVLALKKAAYYGLTGVRDAKKFLYFVPLILIVSVNLWNGIDTNHAPDKILFHILTMLNIGFIEEIIFRGFLFKMMAKTNTKSAIAVSTLTFGIGHIVNLLNGAELIPTLIQICAAISIGYLFVIIFCKSKSLIPCIVTHCLVNCLSVFHIEKASTMYITSAVLILVPLVYAIYINKAVQE